MHIHQINLSKIKQPLDDFGVSYSSLNRLLEYDFSFLKIDLSFIRNMIIEEQKDSIHLVEAIINIGLGLNLSVIAEGVETKEQLDILKKLGCRYIQGYYYGKPEPAIKHLQKAEPMR